MTQLKDLPRFWGPGTPPAGALGGRVRGSSSSPAMGLVLTAGTQSSRLPGHVVLPRIPPELPSVGQGPTVTVMQDQCRSEVLRG